MKLPSHEHMNSIANRPRALGDVTRVRILYVLARGEQPVGSIASALEAQQSTVSKQMSKQSERRNQLDLQVDLLAEQEMTMVLRMLSRISAI